MLLTYNDFLINFILAFMNFCHLTIDSLSENKYKCEDLQMSTSFIGKQLIDANTKIH